jgi:hypothetical protein
LVSWGGLDFSVEPEEKWKKFEEAFYKVDNNYSRLLRVRAAAPSTRLSSTGVNSGFYSNYTDLFEAMVEAERARSGNE